MSKDLHLEIRKQAEGECFGIYRKGPRGVRVGQETGLTDPKPSPDCKEK